MNTPGKTRWSRQRRINSFFVDWAVKQTGRVPGIAGLAITNDESLSV